ncbi:hypothetical protein F1C16_15140 [Hymenobacter sp. NBH84]|nr:hypothetical protein F1C16_15140 [Hymenobacter sp. NBH84]
MRIYARPQLLVAYLPEARNLAGPVGRVGAVEVVAYFASCLLAAELYLRVGAGKTHVQGVRGELVGGSRGSEGRALSSKLGVVVRVRQRVAGKQGVR